MVKAKKLDSGGDNRSAQQVLALLAKHKLQSTPNNYELFYMYLTDGSTFLKDDLRQYIDADLLDEPACKALYNKHFSGQDITDQALSTGRQIGEEMNAVLRLLATAERNTVEYEKTLSGAADALESNDDTASLKRMVETLLSATTKMQRDNHTLEKKLKNTNNEVHTLRGNLQQVRVEAMTDALTGIANRKRFDECMRTGYEAAKNEGKSLCLVLCDIDHFKRFNDTWGHQTGDQIIRFVAGCLQRNATKNQVVARYGGEEFAVIMPGASINNAFTFADNVRAIVESKKLLRKSTNEDMGTVTISMGVAAYEPGVTVEALIECADEALYASKNAGRNKVSIGSIEEKDQNAA